MYTAVRADKPFDFQGGSVSEKALRRALLEPERALANLVLRQYHAGIQHLVFYDNPKFLCVGSISDRLRRADGNEDIVSEARNIRERVREVNFGDAYFVVTGYRAGTLADLLQKVEQVPEIPVFHRQRTVQQRIGCLNWSLSIIVKGSMIEVANMHKVFEGFKFKKYGISFEKKR